MNTTEKHLKTRTIIFLIIAFISLAFGFLITYDFNPKPVSELEHYSMRNRSCLGNPLFLPYAFIGFPLVFFLGTGDILILTLLKKITLKKIVINTLILLFSFLFILILPW